MYNIPRYIIDALCKQPNDLKWRFEKQLKQKIDCCKGCGDVPIKEEPVGPELETIYIDFGNNYPNGSGDVLMIYGDGNYLTTVDQSAPDGIFEFKLPEGVSQVSVVLSQMFSSQQYYLEYPNGTYFEYQNATGQEFSNEFDPASGGIFKLRLGTAPLPPISFDIETEFMEGFTYQFYFYDPVTLDIMGSSGGYYEGVEGGNICNHNDVEARDQYTLGIEVIIPGATPFADLEVYENGVLLEPVVGSRFGGFFQVAQLVTPGNSYYVRRAGVYDVIMRFNFNTNDNVYEFHPQLISVDGTYGDQTTSGENRDTYFKVPERVATNVIVAIQQTPFYQAPYNLVVDGVTLHSFDSSTNYQESTPFAVQEGSIIEFVQTGF